MIGSLAKENDQYYVDHKQGTNVFKLRKYYNQ